MTIYEQLMDDWILGTAATLATREQPHAPVDVAAHLAAFLFAELPMREYCLREVEILARAEELLGPQN